MAWIRMGGGKGGSTKQLYLYKDGDLCLNATNGYVPTQLQANNPFAYSTATSMKLSGTGNTNYVSRGSLATSNLIDLTNKSKITFVINKLSSGNPYCSALCCLFSPTRTSISKMVGFSTSQGEINNQTLEIDISGISGSYYVGAYMDANNYGHVEIDIAQIYIS